MKDQLIEVQNGVILFVGPFQASELLFDQGLKHFCNAQLISVDAKASRIASSLLGMPLE